MYTTHIESGYVPYNVKSLVVTYIGCSCVDYKDMLKESIEDNDML